MSEQNVGRVALVTGASRGIGREVASQLAQHGYEGATKSVQDGAAGIVWLATLADDGPTGGFCRDGEPVAF